MHPHHLPNPTAPQPTRTSRFLAALAVCAGSFALVDAPAANAAIFTVGNTAQGCTSATLDDALVGALLSSGDDIIRVINNQTDIDLQLINWDPDGVGGLTFIGGFSGCTDTTPSGRTTITGNSSGPVFKIEVTGSSNNNDESIVRLEGLDIRNANGFYGVEVLGSGAEVTMVNSSIRFSDGGLRVSAGADVELDFNSAVTSNDVGAGQGGGIHCAGSGSSVLTAGATSFNDAGTGGGIWVTSGCVAALADGAVVEENDATWGGGIAMSGTDSVLLTASGPVAGIDIRENTASLEGGGLWVVNEAAAILQSAWIRDNVAGDEGGGAYVDGNSIFAMDRGSAPCGTSKCSRLDGNELTTEGLGSAVYAGGGSTVSLFQTWIENHTALNQRGFVLFAEDNSTTMDLEAIQLWNNNTWALFRALGNAVIDAHWVSAAANDYLNVLGTLLVSSNGATTDTTGIVSIQSSVLQDHDFFFSTGGGTVTASCSYLSTSSGLDGGTGTLDVGIQAPFLDKARGDLRIYADGVTVDRCNVFAPTQGDLDGHPRGHDEPHGFAGEVHDWGAFEAHSMWFADGFEAGSTIRWSSTTN